MPIDGLEMEHRAALTALTSLLAEASDAAWLRAADLIRKAGGYRWVGLYEVTHSEIAAIAWTGSTAPAFPRFPRDKGLNGAAVAGRDAVVVQDVSTDARYLTAFATTGAEAIFPIFDHAGAVIGTIDVESDRRDAFSAEDEAFLRACAVVLQPLWTSRLGT